MYQDCYGACPVVEGISTVVVVVDIYDYLVLNNAGMVKRLHSNAMAVSLPRQKSEMSHISSMYVVFQRNPPLFTPD